MAEMRLLMLGMSPEWRADKSKINRFLPVYFWVATPKGWTWKKGKSGEATGPVT